jgi:hypothetical protein
MTKTLEATYDGIVLHLKEPLDIEPNTRVLVTVEMVLKDKPATEGFFATAQSLDLDGPKDWSENLDNYLYGSIHD